MNKFLALALLAGGAFALPATAAVTVGNPAVAATNVDGCTTCTFVVNDAFGAAGLGVRSYSFFSGSTADITPLLLTRSDAGTVATFTIVGIGAQRTAALGANSFTFATAQGTNITAANSYFGFAYTHGGVVTFDYSTPSANSGTFVGSANFAATLGASFSADTSGQPQNSYDALDTRTYSINATATVPEPASWAMMVGGFGLLGSALRRRRTTVRFA